jgi:prohibitin 1
VTTKSVSSCAVDGGERAVIFDRLVGVKEQTVGEGTHFIIPVLQKPYIFDVRTRPRSITSVTGTKGALFGVLPCTWFRPS